MKFEDEKYYYCDKDGAIFNEPGVCKICGNELKESQPTYIKKSCNSCGENFEATAEKYVELKDKCPICFGSLEQKQVYFNVPYIGKYSSASTEEKREILKKRSKDHFKKNIEDKFHQMNKPDYMP